jgi:hypothetical protein
MIDAAEDHRELEPGVLAEDERIVVDLDRELAGRGDDDGADRGGAAIGRGRVCQQPLENRDQEGRGLACAGLGLAGHVAARQRDGQCFTLDRGTALEAGILDALQDGRREGEVREADLGKMLIGHFTFSGLMSGPIIAGPLQIGAEGAKIWARYSGTLFRAVPATQLLLKFVSVTV